MHACMHIRSVIYSYTVRYLRRYEMQRKGTLDLICIVAESNNVDILISAHSG